MVNKESKSGARVVPVQLRSRSSQQCPCPWRNRHRPRAKVIGACTVHLEHKRTRQRLLVGRPRSLPIATAKINRNALSEPRGGRASRSTQQSRNLWYIIYIFMIEICDDDYVLYIIIVYYHLLLLLLCYIMLVWLLSSWCLFYICGKPMP